MGLEPQPLPPELPGPGDDLPPGETPAPTDPTPDRLNPRGETTYRNSFVTDLPVGPDPVVELAACGRARWKIENETFNVLKNQGYNLEHSFGHGKQNLSVSWSA